MKKLGKNIKKTIIICAGFLAVMVLIICGVNACDKKMVKDFQENKKLALENLDKSSEVYALAEKNMKALTKSLNRVMSYIEKHPEIIDEFKNYDWRKLNKRYESLLNDDKLLKAVYEAIKSNFENGSVIQLYKSLIFENERIAASLRDAIFGRSYSDNSTHLYASNYIRMRSYMEFTHRLVLSIMKELGHNPYKETK